MFNKVDQLLAHIGIQNVTFKRISSSFWFFPRFPESDGIVSTPLARYIAQPIVLLCICLVPRFHVFCRKNPIIIDLGNQTRCLSSMQRIIKPTPQNIEVQLPLIMRIPRLASALKRSIIPLKIVIMDIKNGQGGESLFVAPWLSYEKLNLCMLCAHTRDICLYMSRYLNYCFHNWL